MRNASMFCSISLALIISVACDLEPIACDDFAAVSVNVNVVDDAGQPVNDAMVVYSRNGAAAEECQSWSDGGYSCGYEVDGDLEITVSHAYFEEYTQTVSVTSDECHVQGETLDVQLVPLELECDASIVASLELSVFGLGETNSDPYELNDAAVSYSIDGGAVEDCQLISGNAFVCGWELAGEITYTATHPSHGAVTGTVQVDLNPGDCHPATKTVEVEMSCLNC